MSRDFRKLKRKHERISQHGLGAAGLNGKAVPLNSDGHTRYRVRLLGGIRNPGRFRKSTQPVRSVLQGADKLKW